MEDRYVFVVEWFDVQSSLTKQFNLSVFVADNSVELFDIKQRRVFLRKTKIQNISLDDLFIGSSISIYSRSFKIISYADDFTKNKFSNSLEPCILLVKPEAISNLGDIISAIKGLKISKLKLLKISKFEAEELYAEHKEKPFFEELTSHLASNKICAIEIIGQDAIKKMKILAGNKNTQIAKIENPESLRARFGGEGVKNGVHVSEDLKEYKKGFNIFFNHREIEEKRGKALALIKPHVIKENKLGEALSFLLPKIKIDNIDMVYLDKNLAEEFFELYKDIIPEFNDMIQEVTQGPCVVIECFSDDNNGVQKLKNICGNFDPSLAKHNTFRKMFGKNRIKNGIHCTDLEEDGEIECEFFFVIMQTK